jgi:hypothetical protein
MRYASTRRSESATAVRPPMLEQLERRELMSAVINEANIKVRNASAGGFSTNQSVIKIPLSEEVNIADPNLIQVRGYAINPLTGNQKKLVINIVDVKVVDIPGETYGIIEITTDRLMRKGGRIYFYAGSLTNQSDGSAVAEQIVRSPRGQNKERFTLASRAFRPTNIDLLSTALYPSASAPIDASSAIPEATVTADLTAFLNAKVTKGLITAAERDEALDTYDDATNRQRVPDHNLRAALVSLTGTIAESAITTYLTGDNLSGSPYTILAFQTTTDNAVIAETQVLPNGRLRMRIKPGFQGEHFAALSAIVAHEAVHQDATFTIQEEVIANLFQDVVYAQQLDVDESIASEGTALVKLLNTQQLALLNSGRGLFPIVGTLQGPILHAENGVFPGGKNIPGGDYVSYTDYLTRQYAARGGTSGTSPGNGTLEDYFDNFVTSNPAGDFGDTLITTLDTNLFPVLTNPMAVRIAGILDLTV